MPMVERVAQRERLVHQPPVDVGVRGRQQRAVEPLPTRPLGRLEESHDEGAEGAAQRALLRLAQPVDR
eukprot:4305327-Prymnesium_polylepis.1